MMVKILKIMYFNLGMIQRYRLGLNSGLNHIMSPDGDFIGDGNNYAILFAKYFTSDWVWLGMETSEQFNSENAIADEWYNLEAFFEVPNEASIVQIGLMYFRQLTMTTAQSY